MVVVSVAVLISLQFTFEDSVQKVIISFVFLFMFLTVYLSGRDSIGLAREEILTPCVGF